MYFVRRASSQLLGARSEKKIHIGGTSNIDFHFNTYSSHQIIHRRVTFRYSKLYRNIVISQQKKEKKFNEHYSEDFVPRQPAMQKLDVLWKSVIW